MHLDFALVHWRHALRRIGIVLEKARSNVPMRPGAVGGRYPSRRYSVVSKRCQAIFLCGDARRSSIAARGFGGLYLTVPNYLQAALWLWMLFDGEEDDTADALTAKDPTTNDLRGLD
jgi:hypothetical protein